MNRQNVCNDCGGAGHIARFCDSGKCIRCHGTEHIKRDCPLRNQDSEVKIYFPFNHPVRAAVTTAALREIPRAGANMQFLRDLPVTHMNGSRFSSDGNMLTIKYSGREMMCVSLQDSATTAETLIQIGRAREGENDGHRVQISARFTIQREQLIEDPDRVATGYQHQQSPFAHTHVLCFVREMLGITCAIAVDGRRFYMDWNSQVNDVRFHAEVNVTTVPGYNYRLWSRGRTLVANRREYFQGPEENRAIEMNQQEPAASASIEGNDNHQGEIDDNKPQEVAKGEPMQNDAMNIRPNESKSEFAPVIGAEVDAARALWIVSFLGVSQSSGVQPKEEDAKPSDESEPDDDLAPNYAAHLE